MGEIGQGHSIIPDGAKPAEPAAPLARPRRARAPRGLRTPKTPTEPAAPFVVQEQPQDESLKHTQEALERAYSNLVEWHATLAEGSGNVFTKGGVIPVRTNGHVVNYDVTVDKVNPRDRHKHAWTHGEPTDIVHIRAKDEKRGQQPREITMHYKEGKLGKAEGLVQVRSEWDIKDGLTGEAIVMSNGRIDYIFKAGRNNVYINNPHVDEMPSDVSFSESIKLRWAQDMTTQFVYDDQGNLAHHYTHLGNWERPLFWYVDGKEWDKETPIPNFRFKSGLKYVDRTAEDERLKGTHIFWTEGIRVGSDGRSDTPDYLNPQARNTYDVNYKTEDGGNFVQWVTRPPHYSDPNTKYEEKLEVPLTFDVLPHILRTFPGGVEGVVPLVSGEMKRMLRLQIDAPFTPAQKHLVRFVQEATRAGMAWEGVTTNQLKETYNFLTRDEVLDKMLDHVGDFYGIQENLYERIIGGVPIGFRKDEIQAGVTKLIEKGVFRELGKVHGGVEGLPAGLTKEDLKWTLSAVLQGQTDLIDGSDPEVGRLDRVRAQLATIRSRIPKLSFGRRRR